MDWDEVEKWEVALARSTLANGYVSGSFQRRCFRTWRIEGSSTFRECHTLIYFNVYGTHFVAGEMELRRMMTRNGRRPGSIHLT